jgi:DNA invertase Pin-like site-specific DNA recombinase
MAKCYGYGRHSTDKQGMTKEVQEAKCEEYFKRHLQPEGYEWGGFYYDPAVSGSSPFAEREYGRQVFLLAQRGDMIVTAAMDRMFRSRKDGFHTLDMLEARGVKHVLLDMPMIDFDRMPRAYAEYMQGTLLLSAQLMRRVVSERMKEDNAIKRQQGLPYSRSAPIGWKIVGDRKSKAYRVDHLERKLCDHMQDMRDSGMSYDEIAQWNYTQKQFTCKRSFFTGNRVKWALRARMADYPLITNMEEFSRKWRSGQIVLCRT